MKKKITQIWLLIHEKFTLKKAYLGMCNLEGFQENYCIYHLEHRSSQKAFLGSLPHSGPDLSYIRTIFGKILFSLACTKLHYERQSNTNANSLPLQSILTLNRRLLECALLIFRSFYKALWICATYIHGYTWSLSQFRFFKNIFETWTTR